MNAQKMKRLGALVGAALPVLLSGGAAEADSALAEEGVKWCVEVQEKAFECKEAFADLNPIILQAPPERRRALRAKFLEEITADGSGPREPREEKCRAMVSKFASGNTEEARARLDGMKKLLAFCSAKEDCPARAECMTPFMRWGQGKKLGKPSERSGAKQPGGSATVPAK